MSETIVRFELSESDIIRLYEHYLRMSPVNRGLRRLTCAVTAAVAGWCGYRSGAGAFAVIWALLGLAVPMGLYRWGGPAFNRAVWRRQLRDGRGLGGSRTLWLDAEGIHGTSAQGESTTRWTAIHRIDETADYIYFMMTASGIPVPKRAFPDAAEVNTFLARAREHQQAADAAERRDPASETRVL
jgi:hypothetical protein